jgi:hypothetical protein
MEYIDNDYNDITDNVFNYSRIVSFKYTQSEYKIRFNNDTTCEILIIGGGGGGGAGAGGGGGAGGLVYSYLTLTAGDYTLKVGKGGESGSKGVNSSIIGPIGYIAYGGGSGESMGGQSDNNIRTAADITHGGSGGGGNRNHYTNTSIPGRLGGSTISGIDRQGYDGGEGKNGHGNNAAGGGGGGAGTVGYSAFVRGFGADGGEGKRVDITGTPTFYAGGGAGGSSSDHNIAGKGGEGGGDGAITKSGETNIGSPGTNGLGGGGGGGSSKSGFGGAGGTGGSGIIIISHHLLHYNILNINLFNLSLLSTESSVDIEPLYKSKLLINPTITGIYRITFTGSHYSYLYINENANSIIFTYIVDNLREMKNNILDNNNPLISINTDGVNTERSRIVNLKNNQYYPIVIVAEKDHFEYCYLILQKEIIQSDRSKTYINTPINIVSSDNNISSINVKSINNKFNINDDIQPYENVKFSDLRNLYVNSDKDITMTKLYTSLFSSISTGIFNFEYTNTHAIQNFYLYEAFTASDLEILNNSTVVNYNIPFGGTLGSSSIDNGAIIINLDNIFEGIIREFNLYINRYITGAHGKSISEPGEKVRYNGGNGGNGENGGPCIQIIYTNPPPSVKSLNIYTNNNIMGGKCSLGGVGGRAGRPSAEARDARTYRENYHITPEYQDEINSVHIRSRITYSGVVSKQVQKFFSSGIQYYNVPSTISTTVGYRVSNNMLYLGDEYDRQTYGGDGNYRQTIDQQWNLAKWHILDALTALRGQTEITATDGNRAIESTLHDITQNTAKIVTPIKANDGAEADRVTQQPGDQYISGNPGTGGTSGIDGPIINQTTITNLLLSVF